MTDVGVQEKGRTRKHPEASVRARQISSVLDCFLWL